MAMFPQNILGMLLFCGCVMVIGIIQVRAVWEELQLSCVNTKRLIFAPPPQCVIVLYAFSRPFLLDEQIQISENQNFYRSHILKVIMRVPIMCFFAIIFSFIFFQLVGGADFSPY